MSIGSIRVGLVVTTFVATSFVVCACSGASGNEDLLNDGSLGLSGAFGGGGGASAPKGAAALGKDAGAPTPKDTKGDAGAKKASSGEAAAANACTAKADDSSCELCLKSSCCSEAKACGANNECVALVQCADPCADQECVDACTAEHPSGAALFRPLIQCLKKDCTAKCQ